MFHSARLKLTAWYLLIIMCISMSFSMVIYRVLTTEVDRLAQLQRTRIERRLLSLGIAPNLTNFQNNLPAPFAMDPDLVSETESRLLFVLIIVNGSIIILAGGLGWFLAGRTLRPIQQMLDEQNQFISDSSHELRTPLTSLKSAFEVNLRDKNLTLKGARQLIAESVDEVNKLQSLSDELLMLAQFQKPNGSIVFEKLALGDIAKKAIHNVSPLATIKHIVIDNGVKDIAMSGNAYGILDLLVILLDNAIKYSPEKTVVNVTSKKTDGFVDIAVQDRGIGINQKDIPHIFDRFYRADAARSKNEHSGYGLGLAIAKKIIDLHHGSISVKSTPGKGSTFMIRLPINRSS